MTSAVFYFVFFFVFVFGGQLALVGIVPPRQFFLAAPALMLVFVRGFSFDRITAYFLVFTFCIVLSALSAGASLAQFLMFLRFVVTPFSMYYLVKCFLRPSRGRRLLSICFAIAYIQAPLVILQRLFADEIADWSAFKLYAVDAGFGTFFVSDPPLCFFLFGLIIFLLFTDEGRRYTHQRYGQAIYLSLTVLLTNAKIAHFMLVALWGYYVVRHLSFSRWIVVGVLVGGLLYIVASFGLYETVFANIESGIEELSAADETAFLEAKYSRAGAIVYYASQPLKLLGDGPSAYFDPSTNEYVLGNMGGFFTFYSEIGSIGLLAGLLVMYKIARHSPYAITPANWLLFLVLVGFTITVTPTSDLGMMLVYNIFLNLRALTYAPVPSPLRNSGLVGNASSSL